MSLILDAKMIGLGDWVILFGCLAKISLLQFVCSVDASKMT